MGKIGIAFFAFLALWLLWKCIVKPLWREHNVKKIISFAPTNTAQGVGKFFLIVVLFAVVVALLHIVGLGVFELIKSFQELLGR